MHISEAQRFVYRSLLLLFATLVAFAVINLYAVDLFIMVLGVEFLALFEVTEASHFAPSWRKNIKFFIMLWVVVLVVIIFEKIFA